MVSPDAEDTRSGGRLARGWSPSRRSVALLAVLLGLVLVANPLVGGVFDAAGLRGDVEYAAVELEPTGQHLELTSVGDPPRSPSGLLATSDGLDGVDCYPGTFPARACTVESGLTDQELTGVSEPLTWEGYTYQDGFYRRTVVERGADGVTLGLEPVPAAAVLANVSIDAASWSGSVRQAVDRGSVTVDPPLAQAGAVLERNGDFFVVVPAEQVPKDEPAGPVYTAVFTLLGAAFVQYGRLVSRR